MTETRSLSRFASIANAAFNSMTANSTAVTSMTIGGVAMNANGVASNTFTIGTAAYFVANGNLGIGTSAPGYKLQVETGAVNGLNGIAVLGGATATRSIELRPAMGAGNNNGLVQAGDSGIIFSAQGANTGAFVIAPWASGTSGIRIDGSTGNIGIGTSSPQSLLDVKNGTTYSSSGDFLVKIQQNTNTTGQNGLSVLNAWASANSIILEAGMGWNGTAAGYYPVFTVDGIGQVIFRPQRTEAMRVDFNGNVGVGTTSPLARLDVVSSDRKRIRATGAAEEGMILFQNGTTGTGSTSGFLVGIGGDSIAYLLNYHNSPTIFHTAGVERVRITTDGHFVPGATNTYDLGSSSLRWRNIFTQDLHLSNGIGDYTIIEGESDLFIVNNKSNKSFKFALIEVDPSQVPPKSNN